MQGEFVGRRGLAVLSTIAVLSLGLAACGDDDESEGEETTAASLEEVTLTATEYEFNLSDVPAAETKTVEFVNEGEEPHVLVFARINDGFTIDEAIKLQGKKGSAETLAETQAAPGATEVVELDKPLEPGSYAMLCPLRTKDGEAHYDLGQLAQFDIG